MSGAVLEHNPHGQGRTRASCATDELGVVGQDDPAWCSTSWKPQEFQEKVLACERGIVFAVGGIGSGKSEAGALRLLKWALQHPRRKDGTPTRWYIVGPEFSLIRKEQFSKVLNHARRLRELGYSSLIRRVVQGQDPYVVLRDGQVLLGRSGDHYQRMEGFEVDGAWMDEAQRQPEKAFSTMCSRTRSSDDFRVVVTASPEDAPGWIWRGITGQDPKTNKIRRSLLKIGSGFRCFRWNSRANQANDAGVLDVIASVLEAAEEGLAAQKMSGRFPGTEEAPSLGAMNHARAFVPSIALTADSARPVSVGVDVGETDDFTWMSVMGARGDVLHMERWNANTPGIARTDFYPILESRTEELVLRWKAPKLVIDTAKAGKPIAQNLTRKLRDKATVIGYDTGAGRRKAEAIEALGVAMGRGDVRIPLVWILAGQERRVDQVEQLRKEFEEVVVVNSGERRSYDHPRGGHDDGIVSLALAWHGLALGGSSPTTFAWGTVTLGPRKF